MTDGGPSRLRGRPLRTPWAGPLGLHHPGTSLVHRAPAGAKLVALAAFTVAVVALPGPVAAAGLLGLALAASVVARLPWARHLRALTPVLVTAAVLGAYQVWQRGPAAAAEVVLDLLAVVLAGTVVTATTRSDALLATVAGATHRLRVPLRRVGLHPETIALAVSLFLRTVPVLVRVAAESRDAARARGLERSPRAVVVPAAVRMVGHARATGDALAARGLGED
ncbi:hypothetical protein GCM10023113_14990 [Cellulomonas oligotrophica]|uniref:Energy-coupling factor transporter transmembrane protein EcfT n=1 Tax=Cellulomonas oligotrophica TaxID=931536 RepID=A0ABQ4D7A2_9CELL|nr:hypothetical protein Col01nite_07560 [Cellulomonas oligotrophica]